MINDSLEKLGLRDEEIKTFIFLLENGPQTAGSLAKKTGLSRPSLYGFLSKLQKIGLVIESQKNGIKTFQTSSKEKVATIFDEQIKELSKGKSDMENAFSQLAGKMGTTPRFQLFEGKKGLEHVLKDMLLYRNMETKAYWPIKSMIGMLGEEFFKQHNKERIARNISISAIWPASQSMDIPTHPYLGAGEAFLREIRIAPKEIDFEMGYWIYENKVVFLSSKKESFGFIIESNELMEMMSSQFEVVWKISQNIG